MDINVLNSGIKSLKEVINDPDIDYDGTTLMNLTCGYLRDIDAFAVLDSLEVADIVVQFIPCLDPASGPWYGQTELESKRKHIFGLMVIRTPLTSVRRTLRLKCLTECIITSEGYPRI